MPNFDLPYFQIELPANTVDASSFCYALPASGRFHPSIVIKFRDLPAQQQLKDFAAVQVKKMQGQLKDFEMLEQPRAEGPDQISLSYRWGADDSRFRQFLIFRQRGVRVFMVTGTLLEEGGLQHANMLQAAMRSFRPK
ncbi:MAG: DcrB-related protein [Bryobacteraceae bacterium]|jgi:hypothetical protein